MVAVVRLTERKKSLSFVTSSLAPGGLKANYRSHRVLIGKKNKAGPLSNRIMGWMDGWMDGWWLKVFDFSFQLDEPSCWQLINYADQIDLNVKSEMKRKFIFGCE